LENFKERTILLKDGAEMEVTLSEQIISEIKKQYNINEVSDLDIKNFFAEVISDALVDAEKNTSDT
jgi:hypothetical protein|tara:strand:- start:1167 stop:1364 length:198 start_codon:yes stop_codon:yes gene_type:complete